MDRTEVRRKSVPGARELIIQIKQISNDITSIDTEIKECQDKIHTIIISEKNASPRARLTAELREISDSKNGIVYERKEYLSNIDNAKNKIESLKSVVSSSNTGYNSIEKINKALEDLELRLISTSISAKEESDISNAMSNLKGQRCRLSDVESNLKQIDSLNASIREYKAKVTELSKQLNEKTEAINQLKAELDKLSETSKNKSPEILKLENKIAELKKQKAESLKIRNTKREEVHTLEEEYSKFEAELLVQKALEEQKNVIRKRIESLKAEKDNLLNEQNAYDPKMYDSLVFKISQLKKAGIISLDIDLVAHLMKNRIPIPSSVEGLNKTIELLEKKKENCSVEFKERREKLRIAMNEIDSKIAEEVQKLNELPATDYEILKKGGLKGNFRNK